MFRSIKTKLTVSFCGIAVFFTLASGMLMYRVFTDNMMQMQQRNQDMLAGALCTSIEFFREQCENEINEIENEESFSSAVFEWVIEDNSDRLLRYLDDVKHKQDYINNIFVMKPSYDYIGTEELQDISTYMVDRISTAERYGEMCVWDSGYAPNSIMIFRCFKVDGYDKNVYLFMQIKNEYIQIYFNRFRLQNNQRFSLKGITNGFEVTEQGFFYQYYENYDSLLHTQMNIGDWYLRTWTENTVASSVSAELLSRLAIVFFFILILAFILSTIISRQVTKPIKQMEEVVKQYSKGNFETKINLSGKDEITELGNVLNIMATKITELINSVIEKEQQSKFLELQTLVYQINPHFLYNTLDSINMLARKNSDLQVANMVTNLSRLFRLSLNRGMDMITVREEIAHVTYYLKIQKFRFEDQLDWHVDVSEDILDIPIMKFIMQPIVENAIYHGIKSKNKYGFIAIRCERKENNLVLVVEDTGKGMDKDTLEKLNQRMNDKIRENRETRGYGIWNVNQRIKMFYGEQYGITIESVFRYGTKISITIPAKVKKGSDSNS